MANYYRVKNGNWDLAESWATTSGGSTYYANPPTSADDVFFDANTPSGTHTVNVTATMKTLNCTGFTGILGGSCPYFEVYGNVTLSSGMTWSVSALYFCADATLITNGKIIQKLYASSSDLTLGDNLNVGDIFFTGGSLIHNNKKVIFKDANGTAYSGFSISHNINNGLTFYDLEIDGDGNNYVYFDCKKIIVEHLLTLRTDTYMAVLGYRAGNDACELNVADAIIENCSLYKIKGSGDFGWDLSEETSVGNGGMCENITFCDPITMYWVGDSAGWRSVISRWKTSSGGSTTVSRLPLAHDTLVFDENSFSKPSQYVAFAHGSTESFIPSIIATAVTNSPEFKFNYANSKSWWFCGSFEVADTVTLTFSVSNSIYFSALTYTTKCNVNMGGNIFNPTAKTYNFYFKYGVWTLTRNLTVGAYVYVVPKATLDLNNFNLVCNGLIADGFSTLKLGTGKTTITGLFVGLYQYYTSGGTVVDAANSIIEIKGIGDGFYHVNKSYDSYGKIIVNTSSAMTIRGEDGLTINFLEVKSDIKFYKSLTYTINSLKAFGKSTSKLSFTSSDGENTFALKIGTSPGKIWCNYLNVSYATSTDADTWYMGSGSTDSGNNNENILFSSIYPNPPKGANMLLNIN